MDRRAPDGAQAVHDQGGEPGYRRRLLIAGGGRADLNLRFYGVVQFLPMLLMPVILLLSKGGSLNTALLWMSLGAYGAAKLAEHFDLPILEVTGVVSGHTLKHLAAGAACGALVRLTR